MATVNEQNLEKVERILYQNAKLIKHETAKICRELLDACKGTICTDEELRVKLDEIFEDLNLKEYFKMNIKFLCDKKMSQEDSAEDIYEIDFFGLCIPITIEEVSEYGRLKGEEKQKYIDELYMRKLCERLKEN